MRNAFKYLSQYSTTPKYVHRLIISAFLEINKLTPKKNELLKAYSIERIEREEYTSLIEFVSIINSDTKEFGFEQCYLETLPYMEGARKLYRKVGFKDLEAPMGDTGHYSCNLWMLKDL